MKKTLVCILPILFIGLIFSFTRANAASLLLLSDAVTNHAVNAASDHEIVFTTPTGVHAPTSTIRVSLSGFDLSTIVANDITLTHGPTTGSENTEVLAAAPGAGVWGVGISGSAMTLTPPTDAGAGTINANDIVRMNIGLAAGGTHQITNPSSAGGYLGIIDGAFGDTGTFGLAVVENGQILVSGEFRGVSAGGHTPPSADTVPPIIVNVVSTSTSPTSALIQWLTNESANASVDFGRTSAYASGTISDSGYAYQHSITLTDLTPCSTYFYQVRSSDASGNQAVSSGYTFQTACDTAPPVITNVRAEEITDSQAVIRWSTNEPATTRVEYGTDQSYASSTSIDGYVTMHTIPISGLLANTPYYYRVISTDASGNTSISEGWIFTTTADVTPPTNVFLQATAGDGLVVLEWTSPIDADAAGVRIVRRTDRYPFGPSDGNIVYEGSLMAITDPSLQNGVTYYYGAYVYDHAGNFSSGSLASATPQQGIVLPITPPPVIPTSTVPVTPIPVTPTSTPVIPPEGTTSTTPVIPGQATSGTTITFEFLGANGTLPLGIDDKGVIGVRGNAGITVRVPADSLNGTARYVVLIVGDFIIQLQWNASHQAYEGTFSVSPKAYVSIKGQALFTDGRVAEQNFIFHGYAPGIVLQSPLFGNGFIPVPGAEVKLYREQDGQWTLWNGTAFGESNPQLTSESGTYLFEIPAGRYYAEISKDGYETRITNPETITTNIFNQRIELIYIPKSLREVFETSTSTGVIEKFGVIAEWVAQHVNYQLKKLCQLLNSSDVQSVNTQIITPAAIIISSATLVTSVSIFTWVTYAQYLFTQPFLLLWRRRRRRYGVVYNSFTKKPIDLCVVRLLHAETGLIVQTRITDKQGRYFFRVKPGTYHLQLEKRNYQFPSEFVKGRKDDDTYVDVYDGGLIRIREDGYLSFNVPIDPIQHVRSAWRIRMGIGIRSAQRSLAFMSVIVSLGAFVITPTVPMALCVVMQCVIYSVFKRLMVRDERKNWGFVYDAKTLKPVKGAVIRLYDRTYGKLLESQTTNSKGQYGFLVGKNRYSLGVEARGYESAQIEEIDLTKHKEPSIDMAVRLKRI